MSLQTGNDGTHSATYTCVANSALVDNIVMKQGTTTRMTLRKQHDKLNRLQQISFTTNSATAPSGSYTYGFNNANQRTRTTFADGSYWVYDYDSLGQVKSGKKYWSDGTPVAGQQFEYAFDDIGNRTSTKAGGNAVGAALRAASYTANRLNQYSSRTIPGAIDVIGAVKATASVTVNSVAATTRRVEYYHREVSVANSSAPVWQSINVTASESPNSESISGNVFVPKATETYTNDLDGNLTVDGRWSYIWDGENRLIRMVANTPVGPQQRIDFEYDWQGRRISKKVWNNTAGTGTPALEQRFLYDGWNLIAIVDSAFNPTHSFVWGTDLSGSLQGAGGVGGLISMKVHSGANAGTYFYTYDGSGNVVALVNSANGAVAAQYEYSPFGETLRVTASLAKVNPFRFSTKFTDDDSDLAYYGYRHYNANAGNWLSRDPLADKAFESSLPAGEYIEKNLYALVGNSPLGEVDVLGLRGQLDFPIPGLPPGSQWPVPPVYPPPPTGPQPTGVKWCASGKHQWIEYPGGSAGYYPKKATVCGCIWGSAEVVNPDPHAGDENKKCTETVLDPVEYRIDKFVDCVKKKSQPKSGGRYSVFGANCANWAATTINNCKEEAKW